MYNLIASHVWLINYIVIPCKNCHPNCPKHCTVRYNLHACGTSKLVFKIQLLHWTIIIVTYQQAIAGGLARATDEQKRGGTELRLLCMSLLSARGCSVGWCCGMRLLFLAVIAAVSHIIILHVRYAS